MGEKGTYRFSNSTFSDNSAEMGGGISVDGLINSLNIQGCNFIGNEARKYGGGIVVTPGGVANPIIINGSNFINNKAKFGGAIFNGNQSLEIRRTVFDSNQAEQGAVFASNGQSDLFIVLLLIIYRSEQGFH